MADLAQSACRRLCRWRPAGEQRDGLALFRCSGCGSEWVRTQAWAPVDADGSRHPALAAELATRGGPPTSAPGEAEAGRAGTCDSSGS